MWTFLNEIGIVEVEFQMQLILLIVFLKIFLFYMMDLFFRILEPIILTQYFF